MRSLSTLSITEQILYSTCRLIFEGNEGAWEATGFFYKVLLPGGSQSDILVTAKHCVENAHKLKFRIRRGVGEDPIHAPKIAEIEMALYPELVISHPTEDLAAIIVKPFITKVERADDAKTVIFSFGQEHIPANGECDAVSNVIMAGAPIEQYDSFNDHVIFRSGITASHPAFDYKGRPRFLVDISAHEGSSGSPIFSWNPFSFNRSRREYDLHLQPQFKLIGVLESGLDVFLSEGHPSQHVNLGVAVHAKELETLARLVIERIINIQAGVELP
ncbi:MAG: hypothetical protein ABI668_03015 [Sphingorhabdus sp.]